MARDDEDGCRRGSRVGQERSGRTASQPGHRRTVAATGLPSDRIPARASGRVRVLRAGRGHGRAACQRMPRHRRPGLRPSLGIATRSRASCRRLRRVGCYDGERTGAWTPATRLARPRPSTDRLNASLPVEEPDAVLFTMVQGQRTGQAVPGGQGLSEDGRCVPNAILAKATKRTSPAPVTAQMPTASPSLCPRIRGPPSPAGRQPDHGRPRARRRRLSPERLPQPRRPPHRLRLLHRLWPRLPPKGAWRSPDRRPSPRRHRPADGRAAPADGPIPGSAQARGAGGLEAGSA